MMADWLAVLHVVSLLCFSSSPRRKDIMRSMLKKLLTFLLDDLLQFPIFELLCLY